MNGAPPPELMARRPRPDSLELPHDPDAERAVLGAILVQSEALLAVIDKVEPDDFFLDSHRLIFEATTELQGRGESADLVTVSNHLRQNGQLERVGGAIELAALVDAYPDVVNVEHYAAIVRDKSVKRQLMASAQQILATCGSDSGEAKEAVEIAQREIFKIAESSLTGGLVHVGRLATAEVEDLENRKSEGGMTGISTGIADLDAKTSGLQDTDLIILAARPSMGKTSLALNIAAHAALRGGIKVAIFSLEMAAKQLVRRLLAGEARVNQRQLAEGMVARSSWPRLLVASQAVAEAGIWIDDTPGLSLLELSAKARRMKAEHGLDLVVVDYMQLMSAGTKSNSRTEEVSVISRGLKGIAKELEVPMFVLSQLSRQPDRRGGDHRPQLSDLRESGSIEQDADVVMFILRRSVYDPDVEDPNLAELIIAKQRNGPTGTIPLIFHRDYTRFEGADLSYGESLDEDAPPPAW